MVVSSSWLSVSSGGGNEVELVEAMPKGKVHLGGGLGMFVVVVSSVTVGCLSLDRGSYARSRSSPRPLPELSFWSCGQITSIMWILRPPNLSCGFSNGYLRISFVCCVTKQVIICSK